MGETNNEKDNSLNPEEEETSEKETSNEEKETSNKPEKTSEELEEANKKLYARMKKAEGEAKSMKEELAKSKKPSSPVDVFDLAKTVSALRDYTSDELGDIQMIARAKDISPEEAVKTEEAQLIITARREKVAKEKSTPSPSTRQGVGEEEKDLADMTLDEKNEYFAKRGFVKKFPTPKPL